nr:ATP synthase F0 subunit 8 [Sarmydus sp. N117]
MPQMAPLNWLILLFYFTLVFALFNTLNYFLFSYKIKVNNIKSLKSQLIWKW